jgi:heterodisulfide reductase subunit A
MSEVRLGVFLCDCGDQIASILDMDVLEQAVRAMPEVALVQRLRYSCSPDGLSAIKSAVAEHGLNRVLVAGCTPRTLEPRFRAACEKAGLDGDRFELVDIREGCAWVHQDEPEAATAKAVDLIRMGIARCTLRQARQPASAEVVPAALVIGGGLAGMTAALTLASAGLLVKLIEREAALGGMLRGAHTLYPDRRDAVQFLAEKVEAVTGHPRIEVLLESQLTDVSGTVGRYKVSVDGADRSNGPSTFEVGAVIIATGARTLRPWGLFRYDGQRVITQLEFERELRALETGTRPTGFPLDVVMILCAGQRDEAVPYCSGVCCMGALKQALEIKAAKPQANVTILFRDLYLLGEEAYEEQVLKGRRAGVEFIRYAPSSPPVVTGEAVEVREAPAGTERRRSAERSRRSLPCDRVVLATPLIPQPDASVTAHMLNVAQDKHGFLLEERYRLRPQNCAERGVYVCGAAHGPAGWAEVEFQAASAAFRAMRHLQAGHVASQAPIASVDETLCTGCGNCVESCPFGAISMDRQEGVLDISRVDPLVCKGCGNCAVSCPVKAISLPVSSDAQLLAQIKAALAAPRNGRPRILAFGCEWSGHAAAELAGARKLGYPVETRLIRVGCSARLDPLHVLWAFFNGADGVFLGACPPGDCHYVDGNRHARQRIDTLRSMLAESGFDPRRLRLEWIAPDDAHDFAGKIADFTSLVQALGPSPARYGQIGQEENDLC